MKIHTFEPIDVDGHTLVPGRMVYYQTDGRNGLSYTLPAVVTVTHTSHPGDYPDGRTNPLPETGHEHVIHLTYFTPGGIGTVVEVDDTSSERGPYRSEQSESFPDALKMDTSKSTGTMVEHSVPYDPEGGPRTWRWMR